MADAAAKSTGGLTLRVLEAELLVARLSAGATVPEWALQWHPPITSVTRTEAELSIIAPVSAGKLPPDAKVEAGWRALVVAGPLDFALVGILADIARTLADSNVSIFALSTYDTDYILVKESSLKQAREALLAAGHTVE
eukprot:m.90853 g.90853  ORF g.90853 m.90853 type:complete len:139 (+) comp11893_c0_seq1:297-713(+)